jgi:ABC-type multidrug transport system ATPase subunit/ABC-type multidrug transport system permease subunit
MASQPEAGGAGVQAAEEFFTRGLAVEVLKLLALTARADGPVSPEERLFVARFYGRLYPPDMAERLGRMFEEFATSDIDPSEVARALRNRLARQDRIFCLLKTYECLRSDRAHPDEVETARYMGRLLDVSPHDLAFIERSLRLPFPAPGDPQRAGIVALSVGEDADLRLPLPGLDLTLYKIHNLYCLTQHDESQPVSLDGSPMARGISARISHNHSIRVGPYLIRHQDLKIHFENKLHPLDARLYAVETGPGLSFQEERPETPLAMVAVRGTRLTLTPLDPMALVALDRAPLTRETPLTLDDAPYLNGFRVNVRELYYYLNSRRRIPLPEDLPRIPIGNDLRSPVFLQDDLPGTWSAALVRQDEGLRFEPGDCPYQVYLNREPVTQAVDLSPGDALFIHDAFLTPELGGRELRKALFQFRRLAAEGLSYAFEDGTVAVDEVSFDIEYGELTAIIGPSGSGKSTLLNLLSGLFPPSSGAVRVDDFDLHQDYGLLKDFLGYVPQDDLLLSNLTVYENLSYHARLRFPDKRPEELDGRIELVLKDIGMSAKRNLRAGSATDKTLSGGERKRLNIGLELLADAEIYLLDEPTSGLSSKDSEKILEILANIALRGKMVLVVIHQPDSKLYKMFDKIILLDQGGKLAYFGPSYQALEYFKRHMEAGTNEAVEVECPHCKTVQPGILLDTLEDSLKDIDGSSLGERLHSPAWWQEEYRKSVVQGWFSSVRLPTAEDLPPSRLPTARERFSQFVTQFARNLKNKIRDRSNLLITFLEAPFLGAAVGFILRYSPFEDYTLYTNDLLRTFVFVSAIVCIFLSMTNSADEIISDSALFLRERMLNITHRGYLAAKLLVLMLFALIQNALFILAGFAVMEVRELFLPYLAFLGLLSYTAVSGGLFISALPRLSSKAAQNIVPLVLIPQIILGGALIEYEKMNVNLTLFANSPVPEICQFMPSRWAYEGLIVLQETGNSYDTAHEALNAAFIRFKQDREAFVAAHGEEAYQNRSSALSARLEDFRSKYKHLYGNKNIHDIVTVAEKKWREDREGEGQAKPRVYPMFVREKALPLLGPVSTMVYNGLVLAAMALVFNFFTLVGLRFRERMLWGMNRLLRLGGVAQGGRAGRGSGRGSGRGGPGQPAGRSTGHSGGR